MDWKGTPCGQKMLIKQDSSLCAAEVCTRVLIDFVSVVLLVLRLSEHFWRVLGRLILQDLMKRSAFRDCLLHIRLSSKERAQLGTFQRVHAEEWDFPLFWLCVFIWLISLGGVCVRASACVWALDQRWHCILPTSLILCTSGFVHIHPPLNTSFSHYRCH